MQSYTARLFIFFFPLWFHVWLSGSGVVMLAQSKHVFLGRSFKVERRQMCRELWAARFQAQLNRTRACAHNGGTYHSAPFLKTSQYTAERWKNHLCNRNQETRTSRDPSWQLSYNGGRLTAIVTKACTKFICFMTRQALTLFQRNYLDDLCVPAGQETSLKTIQQVLACFHNNCCKCRREKKKKASHRLSYN